MSLKRKFELETCIMRNTHAVMVRYIIYVSLACCHSRAVLKEHGTWKARSRQIGTGTLQEDKGARGAGNRKINGERTYKGNQGERG